MAFGGGIQSMLAQLEQLGFFDFVLPFLLIFSVVYGILQFTHILADQKAIHIIVSIILGLLALRLPFFSVFLAEMSPRLGVGLVILLFAVILIGLFTPEDYRDIVSWILLAIGAVIFVVIVIQSSSTLNYFGYGPDFFSGEIIGWIVMIAILAGIIIAATAGSGESGRDKGPPAGLWAPVSGGKKGHG